MIPDSISQLTKLNNLRINGNKLKTINKNIINLKNLNELYLQNNEIS